MIIVISPSKTQIKATNKNAVSNYKYFDKSNIIRNYFKSLSNNEIQNVLNISNKLIDTVIDYYNDDTSFIKSIDMYSGHVFKNLDYSSLEDSSKDHLSKHLRILSAMYGILKPDDYILNYRLDFLVKYPDNLYTFWKTTIQDELNSEIILNLSSKEYALMLNDLNIINVHFIHILNNKQTTKATYAKISRGQLLRYIAINKIDNIDDVKKFENQYYIYDDNISDNNNLYFIGK